MQRRHALVALAYAAMTAAMAPVGYWQMYLGFRNYDDEGTLLTQLRDFVHGNDLYEEVFSQYGPFYYELFGGFYEVTGLAIGMDSGRGLQLTVWLAASLGFGVAAHALTRRLGLGLMAQVLSFATLVVLRNEPMHPVGLISVLVAAVVVALALIVPRRPVAGLVTAGALAALLGLTKVNLGGFALIAIAFACALVLPATRRLEPLRWALIGVAVLTPLAIQWPDMVNAQNQIYVIVVTAGVVAVAVVAFERTAAEAYLLKWLGMLAAGAAGATFVVLLVIVIAGTPPFEALDAIFIRPGGQRDIFGVGPSVEDKQVLLALAGLGAAIVLRPLIAAGGVSAIGGVARIVAGGAIAVTVAQILTPDTSEHLIVTPIALAWVAAAPPRASEIPMPERLARVAVVAVAVLQELHAYPVAGSHLGAGAVAMTVVAALCVHDGIRELALSRSGDADARLAMERAAAIGVVLALLGTVFLNSVARPARDLKNRFANTPVLPFQTADKVRVESDQYTPIVDAVAAVQRECGELVTAPGMNSFYEWTGKAPPTTNNTGPWEWALDDEQQQEVVDAVDDDPRACVLRNDDIRDFWNNNRGEGSGPLLEYIQEYVEVADFGLGYKLYVKPERAKELNPAAAEGDG